jgi:glutamine amidotransferase
VKIVVLDHGAGNLHSLSGALTALGAEVRIESDVLRACGGDALVIPGVGGFAPVAARLEPSGAVLRDALSSGTPCLAICLGMQLLFGDSEEGEGRGLEFIAGETTRVKAQRIPHMGWNRVEGSSMLPENSLMYFAHSFVVRPVDAEVVRGWTTYDDDRFPAIVRTANTLGVQFHPEKSGAAGRKFLAAWLDEAAACV